MIKGTSKRNFVLKENPKSGWQQSAKGTSRKLNWGKIAEISFFFSLVIGAEQMSDRECHQIQWKKGEEKSSAICDMSTRPTATVWAPPLSPFISLDKNGCREKVYLPSTFFIPRVTVVLLFPHIWDCVSFFSRDIWNGSLHISPIISSLLSLKRTTLVLN